MPRSRKAAAPAETEIVTCLESFTSDGYTYVRQGDRLAATHELAQAHPNYFVRDGVDSGTRLAALTALHSNAAPTPEPAPEPSRMMRAIKPISGVTSVPSTQAKLEGGFTAPLASAMISVAVGDVLPATSEIVSAYPDAFEVVDD